MADGQAVSSRGIHKAMLAVMHEVGVIGKGRTNPQQGYQFRGIDDVLAELQPLFVKHGIVCTPRVLSHEREVLPTKSGGSMASVRLLVEHTYEAADGSTMVATTFGEAMDSGDKASNKAMSAALKYAHTESFSIPTRESDRDTEEQSPELASKAPAAKPAAQATSATRPASSAVPRPVQKPQASSGVLLPNYGSLKGLPVAGQRAKDLEYYRAGCMRSLGDPSKAKWHDKERVLLAAIDDELSRHTGAHRPGDHEDQSEPDEGPPPPGDNDAPF